jgi:hypothetical protein
MIAAQLLPRLELEPPSGPGSAVPVSTVPTIVWQVERVGPIIDFTDPENERSPRPTPWELACREALIRARALWNEAIGTKRPARAAGEAAADASRPAAMSARQAELKEADIWSSKFVSGRRYTIPDFVGIVLPRTKPALRRRYFEAWRTTLPDRDAMPSDDVTPIGNDPALWIRAQALRAFVDVKGEGLRKQWLRASASKAGKKGVKARRLRDGATSEEEIGKFRLHRGGRKTRHDGV